MNKRILSILILVTFLFAACGGDTGDDALQRMQTETVKDSIPTLQGQFIYLADAAVLKGENFIYGVTIDSLALDLATRVRPFKKENFDMVPVKVKAKIVKNPGTKGWDEFIEIQEIIEAPIQTPDTRD